ncbi:hypothetical protein X798_06202 [Onchocerca flexuosa]|uniref:Uncharacterized protein n=1 Tax=Onchocerca flexuosa TaxID=387005 RepID=A0A238BQ53_9BILA|nr:hypothetical protein X798_06202 [Onchocerca flexuosa]
MKKKKQLKEQVYRAKLRIRLGDERKEFFKNSLPILDYILVMIDGLTLEADPPYQQIQYMFEKVTTCFLSNQFHDYALLELQDNYNKDRKLLMIEMGVKWDDFYDWEETEKIQSKQLVSMNGVISTTSTAMDIYSKCRSTQLRVAMTTTASTESSSSLPYVQIE